MPQFMQDVEQIRERARQKIEDGAVTEAYRGDVQHTISILNEALATEIVCVLRYMHHYFMATGVHGKSVADEFKEHADAERDHADQIAERIQQLGGKPDFNPGSLVERSASQYVEGETLADMIREDLVAERVVIEVYSDMIRYFGENDPTTRVMVEGILKDEEEHASDLSDLLFIVDPHTGEAEGEDPGTHPLNLHPGQTQERSRQSAGGRSQQRGGGRQQRLGEQGGRGAAEIETPRGPQRAQPAARRAQGDEQSGRPMRTHPQQRAEAATGAEADEGAQGGGTRSVRVTKPNRKRRVA